MKVYSKIVLALALILVSTGVVSAQKEQSPYSKFGYGKLGDYATSMQRNMGGVGIAMQGGRQINVMNPASYAAIDSLTLLWDIGLDLTRLWSTENGQTGKSFGGGLDNLTLQFPIGKIMGGSIGLVPYSSVGYSFGGEVKDSEGNVNSSSSFLGAGGINELYVGLSIRPFKGFSVGANVAYQFGNVTNSSYLTSSDASTSALYEQMMEVRDWNVLIGAQYTMEFRQLHKVTLGATYSPKKDFHGHTWGTYYDINADSKPDTIGYTSLKGGYSKPNAYGVGLAYTYNDRFTVMGDFSWQEWSKASFEGVKSEDGSYVFEPTKFDDRWKVALGMQYTPNPRGNYFQRMSYRLGGNYTNDYITVRSNNVREYGLACGFGFPTLGTKTVINLGFEYKHRTTTPTALITENYFNITLGVNFNEFAFWQNKIR